ncbi:MAG: hypothetical protein ACJ754_04240 [Pyrinomonadaceae bacterium]
MSKAVTRGDKVGRLREIVKAVDICMLTAADPAFYLHSSASLFTKPAR